ncbi:MAG: hypothetical protein FJ087_02570 [Deltaproteobacteria bacterium]|nr:hypothetical protein [Deltaproteobacteria bacterium]
MILLCEDRQHEAFLRRFFVAAGWNKRSIRVEKSPKGRGCAEQWVREHYAAEVRNLRSAPYVARALVVAIDEDTQGKREAQLSRALVDADLPARQPDESIIHAIPARNIETWLQYLLGKDVDEKQQYARLASERDCEPAVRLLKTMCDAHDLRPTAPPSLVRACNEYRDRLA